MKSANTTLQALIDEINDGGNTVLSGDEIAGKYAFKAALYACTADNSEITEVSIESRLDDLQNAGANFDYEPALNQAIDCLTAHLSQKLKH